MTTPTLSEMFCGLVKGEVKTRAARTIEYFGWLDVALGLIILVAPRWTATLLHLPRLGVQDANYLHLVGTLVSALGILYVVSGRLNSEGFIVASLLDRPLVPAIMVVLWSRHILPGPMALAFSVSDFAGFLWTLLEIVPQPSPTGERRAEIRGRAKSDSLLSDQEAVCLQGVAEIGFELTTFGV